MRNPLVAAQTKIETAVSSKVKARVHDHFATNKPIYIACGATAAVVYGLTARAKPPVINVTVNLTVPPTL